MHNKILMAAKKLKKFTLDDVVIMTDIDESIIIPALRELTKNNKIIRIGKYFEYFENLRVVENVKIIDKNIKAKISDITALNAVKIFLKNCERKNLKERTKREYKSFINAHIIPYFRKFILKNITINDVSEFKIHLQEKKISERRIKNILTLLNQVIKYFQDKGYIEKTCVFEVKRLKKIPKREIQILTPNQVEQLFSIIKSEYKYLLPIVQKSINKKMKLADILHDKFYQRNCITKRKIRTDFFKIKQKLNLDNYMFDDLRFSGKIAKI